MHYTIGNLGHLFVIASFVSALFTFIIYVKADRTKDLALQNQWLQNGRWGFYLHTVFVMGIIFSLFSIIYNHYFEYHYAYSHSSLHLPGEYMVSCFWEGQEGSFLLWMFWQAILGVILIRTQKTWEAPVMSVFALVQAFLTSMILGVVIPGLELKIGSSPFVLLRDAMNDPIFQTNPDFVPQDGRGLNPLLQNYWMVIHPPVLFLGFAATLIPFSFCIAGLWYKKYAEWIKPALPWGLFAGVVLGVGILMGGYWAYETLSFGGYWNWDPVENAVYVPWLILIAAVHTMMLYKTTKSGLKISMVLAVSVFILILYSTFLTRSGILGDASVHSFTDLGLSGQLLIYLLVFTVGAIVLMIARWKHIPTTEKEVATWSKEFWIFLGIATLCLMGFQVLLPTSFPALNKFVGIFGVESTMATPANQIEFYSKLQLWFAVVVAILSATAQFFWWKRIDSTTWKKELLMPVLFSLLIAFVLINIFKVYNFGFGLLMFAGVFIIWSNVNVMISVVKKNVIISGGAITHVGVGLMLIGILFSSGYSKVVSLNRNGYLISKEMSTEFNRENLLLFINEPQQMGDYELEFLGERYEASDVSLYIKKHKLDFTDDPYKMLASVDIVEDGKKYYSANDTVPINPENTFYEIVLRKAGKEETVLYPRIQMNPTFGMMSSPDIMRNATKDLYTHVSAPMDKSVEPEWSKMEEVRVRVGQQFFVNDYVAVLNEVKPVTTVAGFKLDDDDVAAQAQVTIQGEHGDYFAQPIFLIRDTKTNATVGYLPDEVDDLGARLTLINIHPNENEFTIGINTRQKDWVVIKAMEKPFINILWLGTGLLAIGFAVAMLRRFREI
jgi:cytochrome c-type biogenesis protein CcmF